MLCPFHQISNWRCHYCYCYYCARNQAHACLCAHLLFFLRRNPIGKLFGEQQLVLMNAICLHLHHQRIQKYLNCSISSTDFPRQRCTRQNPVFSATVAPIKGAVGAPCVSATEPALRRNSNQILEAGYLSLVFPKKTIQQFTRNLEIARKKIKTAF